MALDAVEALRNAHPGGECGVLRREALDGGEQLGRLREVLGDGGLDASGAPMYAPRTLMPLSGPTAAKEENRY